MFTMYVYEIKTRVIFLDIFARHWFKVFTVVVNARWTAGYSLRFYKNRFIQ